MGIASSGKGLSRVVPNQTFWAFAHRADDYGNITGFTFCTDFGGNRFTPQPAVLVVDVEAIAQNVFITTLPNDVVMYRVVLSDRYGA
ncbi:hypothetical protein [Thiothrix sp. UBA2332]|uniref:hypothetical protein n=1 Tax=Thiothrix sp. UBA2332 TaxID=1947696 RepID=UPI0025E1F01E|nr:hypothetical protein [Thiothrix sp. UBA2332]